MKMNASDVRKATIADLPAVEQIFKRAIQRLYHDGIFQWDDGYPDRNTLTRDIERESMYLLMMAAHIVAVFVINREYEQVYESGRWQDENATFAVVHRLCVHPDFQNLGLGTRAMRAAESLLKSQGIESIRLDAFSKNTASVKFYEKLGYVQVGEVHLKRGLFYLFEKRL